MVSFGLNCGFGLFENPIVLDKTLSKNLETGNPWEKVCIPLLKIPRKRFDKTSKTWLPSNIVENEKKKYKTL